MLAAGGALLIGAGAVTNYLRAQQPEQQMSDLTLANIEVVAFGIEQETKVICIDSNSKCKVECDICGGAEYGKGSFRGGHSCSIVY